jgi:hypothetical protein
VRHGAVEVREVDEAAFARRLGVVRRVLLVVADLEAEAVAVVGGRAVDVLDEEDGRVAGEPHSTAASPSSAFTSA